MARPLIHDLTGFCFGDLTVKEKMPVKQRKKNPRFAHFHDTVWVCECTCGNIIYATGGNLRAGNTHNCGNCSKYEVVEDGICCHMMYGGSFLIDADDYERVSQHKWYSNTKGYVGTGSKSRFNLLHRFIMRPDQGMYVDHINGDPSDCRKQNLRIVIPIHNTWNSKIPKTNSTGYKGVYYDRSRCKYATEIRCHGEKKYLGRYDTPEEAAIAYNEAALLHFGEYARLNIIGQPFKTVSATQV